MTNRQGQQLDNYHLIRLLGAGSFGEVYLAEHIYRKSQAPVAIKVLSELAQDDLQSFLTEARISHLRHPNIVQVLDFGVEKRTPFIVMEYAPDGTLRQRHPKGTRVSLPTIVTYVKQIASALQYAHEERLIHRDIKPENMLIGEQSRILLSDFGLATIARSMSSESVEKMAGTILYMSPEQIQSHPYPASDQYSLGVVVYEWLCGERPFQGTFAEIAMKHTMMPPPPLREKISTIASDVEQIVMKALTKDPKQRFDSVLAFATTLEQACANTLEHATWSIQPEQAAVPAPSSSSQESTVPTVESTRELTQLWISRRKMVLGLGAGLLVATGGLAWLVISHRLPISLGPHQTPIPIPSPKPTLTPISVGSLLYTYGGHLAIVNTVAWSPDGRGIASGSDDNTVQVCNATNGSNISTYRGHSQSVEAVAWSPDSKRIASGSWDMTVQVYNAANGSNISTYHGHSDVVDTVAWSPDSKHIASGSYDKTVQIWDVSNSSNVYTYSGHVNAVSTVSWSPDGKRIASGSFDTTVQVWDAANGGNVYIYRKHFSRVNAVVWSPDGKHIASGSYDKTVHVWNATDGSNVYIYRGHSGPVLALAWSPDGKRIASGGTDNVQVWDAANGGNVYMYSGHHSNEVKAVAWSPDDRRIASGGDDMTVQVWRAG